ncbi:nuclear transport factor 2 family protein [Bradyrhizobium sp. AZCC 2289]
MSGDTLSADIGSITRWWLATLLTLLKLDGKWQIMNKVFHLDS